MKALVIAAAAAAGPVHTPLAPTYGTGAHISSDSKIAASVRVGERTAIKKSVVGPHCVIGKNVKIAGCVIMDHVEIKDGCVNISLRDGVLLPRPRGARDRARPIYLTLTTSFSHIISHSQRQVGKYNTQQEHGRRRACPTKRMRDCARGNRAKRW